MNLFSLKTLRHDEEGFAMIEEWERNIAERRRMTWLCSEEDSGPDCGVVLGLGHGWSLHVGEFADATLREHNFDPTKHEGVGWWVAVCGPDGLQIVGPALNQDGGREMVDQIFAALSSEAPP